MGALANRLNSRWYHPSNMNPDDEEETVQEEAPQDSGDGSFLDSVGEAVSNAYDSVKDFAHEYGNFVPILKAADIATDVTEGAVNMASDIADIFSDDNKDFGEKLSGSINRVGEGVQSVADEGVEKVKSGMGFVGNAVNDVGDWAEETGNKAGEFIANPNVDTGWQLYEQGVAKPAMMAAATPGLPAPVRVGAGIAAAPSFISSTINSYNDGGAGQVVDDLVTNPIEQVYHAVTNPDETKQKVYEHPSEMWHSVLEPGMTLEMPIRGAKKAYDLKKENSRAKGSYDEYGFLKEEAKPTLKLMDDEPVVRDDVGKADTTMTSEKPTSSSWAIREDEYIGQHMPHGENGCVEAVVRLGRDNDFLGAEYEAGQASVPNLVSHAQAQGLYEAFDPSRVEKGDIIVYGDSDHVVMADGEGGYVGNSSSKQRIVHGSDYTQMGSLTPTGLIKTGKGAGGRSFTNSSDTSEVKDLTDISPDEAAVRELDGNDAYDINDFEISDRDSAPRTNPDLIESRDMAESMRQDVDKIMTNPDLIEKAPETVPEENVGPRMPEPEQTNSSFNRSIETTRSPEEAMEALTRDFEQYDSAGNFDVADALYEAKSLSESTGIHPDIVRDMVINHRFENGNLDTPREGAHELRADDIQEAFNRRKEASEPNEFSEPDMPEAHEYDPSDYEVSPEANEAHENIVPPDMPEDSPAPTMRERTQEIFDKYGYTDHVDDFQNENRQRIEAIENHEAPVAPERPAVPLYNENPKVSWKPGDPLTRETVVDVLNDAFVIQREGGEAGVNLKSGVAHADYGDINAMADNIGRIVDAQTQLHDAPGIERFDKDIDLATQKYGDNAPPLDAGKRAEDIGGFVSLYVRDEAAAAKRSPDFYRYFKGEMAKPENAGLSRSLERAKEVIHAWNQLPDGAKMGAAVNSYAKGKGLKYNLTHPIQAIKEKAGDAMERFVEEIFDDKAPLKKVSNEISDRLGRKLTDEENPYIQARLAQGRGEAQASMLIDNDTSMLTKGMESRAPEANAQKVANALNKIFGQGTIQKPVILKDVLNNLKNSLEGKYPEYLKSIGAKNWLEALDTYLISRRLLEVKEVSYREAEKAHEKALAELKELQDFNKELSELSNLDGYENTARYTRDLAGIGKLIEEKAREVEMHEASANAALGYKMPATEQSAHAVTDHAPAELKKAAEQIYQYNDNLMRISRSAGLISNKFYKAMNEKYKAYVPLASDMGQGMESMMNMSSGGGKGIVNIGSVVDAISNTGSTKNVKSPLQTIALNTKRVLSAANRNMAGNRFRSLVEKDGFGDILEKVEDVDSVANQDNLVTIYDKGIRKVYETEPNIKRALECIDAPYEASMIAGILQLPASFLRASCTITPAFLAKNLFRDMMGAPVLGGTERTFKPGLDHAKGLKSRVSADQTWYDYEASGATMANLLTVDRQGVAGMIENLYGEGAWGMTKKILTSPVRLGTWLNELSENATRAGKFAGDLDKGMPLDTAAINAKNVSLDFSRAGSMGRQVNRYIPFFNAAIQEPVRLAEAIKENPKKAAAVIGVSITLPSVITWALNHNEEWYQNLPDNERDTNWFISKDVKIPKPFGLGVLFGSSVERGLDYMAGTNEGRKFTPYIKSLVDALTPGGTPQVITPWLEWASNYSFFKDAPIVPEKYQRLTPDKQYNDSTSQMARDIAGVFGTSPMKVDNLLRGAGGSGVSLGLDTWDAAMGNRNVKNPLKIHSAFTPSSYSRFTNEYYSIKQEVEAKYNSTDKGDSKKTKETQKHRMSQLSTEDKRDYNIFKAADKKIKSIKNWKGLDEDKKKEMIDKTMKDAVKASSRYKN